MGKIYIGSDHAGFKLKREIINFLNDKKYEVEDLGPFAYNKADDYPDYAGTVCEKVLEKSGKGILICGTGQGMSRAANKHTGIYAEVCWDLETAKHAKEHSNANVLCFGMNTIDTLQAKLAVETWLETPFLPEERHTRRFDKIKKIEEKYMKS